MPEATRLRTEGMTLALSKTLAFRSTAERSRTEDHSLTMVGHRTTAVPHWKTPAPLTAA
jgi:hypothetical protein